MADHLTAPWSEEQVDALNAYQLDGPMHSFTCPYRGNKQHFGNEDGYLVATPEGWVCGSCPYTQDWAYPWMADTSWWE